MRGLAFNLRWRDIQHPYLNRVCDFQDLVDQLTTKMLFDIDQRRIEADPLLASAQAAFAQCDYARMQFHISGKIHEGGNIRGYDDLIMLISILPDS